LPRRITAPLATLALIFVLCPPAGAASVAVDLNTWTYYDQPHTGNPVPSSAWLVDDTGTVVDQTVNGLPTFFIAPGDITGHRFSATLQSSSTDGDYFGIALGFSTGTSADFLLIDWRGADEETDWGDGIGPVTGLAGLAVSRVTGAATLGELWGHVDSAANPNGGVTELARGAALGTVGWSTGTPNQFVLDYTSDSLKVWVNGTQEISLAGVFPSGPVALYDFSEPGLSVSDVSIDPLNEPPEILQAATDVTVPEGAPATMSGSFDDPNGDDLTLTCTANCDGFVDNGDGSWTWSQVPADGPSGFTVGVDASDGQLTVSDSFDVSVTNVAPSIVSTSGVPATHDLGADLDVSADFDDPGVLDTHTVSFDWGDGSSSPGVVSESAGSGSAQATHVYTDPGSYNVTVTVEDDDGGAVSEVIGQVDVSDPGSGNEGGDVVKPPHHRWHHTPRFVGKPKFGFHHPIQFVGHHGREYRPPIHHWIHPVCPSRRSPAPQ
jgi:PKD domain